MMATRFWVALLGILATPMPALAVPPPNDDFANAQTIVGNEGGVSVTFGDASRESGEPSHAGNVGGTSIWYVWTAPENGRVTFQTGGNNLNSLLAVYVGSSVDALTIVAANDDVDPPAIGISSLAFDAIQGTVYRIAVDVFAATPTPEFASLSWGPTPTNDNFATAEILSGPVGSVLNFLDGPATREAGEPQHGGQPGGNSVWFRWTASGNGMWTFTLSAGFRVMAVYQGSDLSLLVPVVSVGGGGPGGGDARFIAAAGIEYRIAVQGLLAPSGFVEYGSAFLAWGPTPPNDDFAAAEEITGAVGSVQGRLGGVSSEPNDPSLPGQSCSSLDGHKSVWYQWQAPANLQANFSIFSESLLRPVRVDVFTGGSPDALTLVATGVDIVKAVFAATEGTVYHLAVCGFRFGADESFVLSWTFAGAGPPNDNFASAEELTGPSGRIEGPSLEDATLELGEPHSGVFGRSVWYRWTAPDDGQYAFTTDGTDTYLTDTTLCVFTGVSVDSLLQVACNDDFREALQKFWFSVATFEVIGGTTYYIAVDAFRAGPATTFILNWAPVPVNDSFSIPVVIEGSSGSVTGTILGASREQTEPDHVGLGQFYGRSIWYQWVSPADGRWAFDTVGSGFNTGLCIYGGDDIAALDPIACNDDIDNQIFASRVVFDALTGSTYRIAVDSGSGCDNCSLAERVLGGPVRLNWAVEEPMDTPTATPTYSATASQTRTPTPTPSYTPSFTSTPTRTPTPSATPTRTATATLIASSTPTQTGTPAPSETPSATVTPTSSPTPTSTATSPHTPSATLTMDPKRTPTPNPTHTFTATGTSPPVPTSSWTATPSVTNTPLRAPSATATSTPTETSIPIATQTTSICSGDCDGNNEVTIDELIRGVNIALGQVEISLCTALDTNGDGEITIDELVRAVSRALVGC